MNRYSEQQKKRGAALLIFIVFFTVAALFLVFTLGRGAYQDIVRYRTLEESKTSFFAVDGAVDDLVYRYMKPLNYNASESFTLFGSDISITRTSIPGGFEFDVISDYQNVFRKSFLFLQVGTGASFSFGVQSGNGGIEISNNSHVYGSVFSNGSVIGLGSATVHGDIISASTTGYVNNIHATGTVRSNTIEASQVDGDAYYQTIIGTTVLGTSYPGSPDEDYEDLPIDDATIDEWKTDIETNGTVIASTDPECSGGTYVIDFDTTIGNTKIECNVDFLKQGSETIITLDGSLWIEGDLGLKGATIEVDPSLGPLSVTLIVDNESNRATSSRVTVNTSTDFSGSGDPQSYVMIVSMNDDSENGGSEKAIDVAQTATGDILLYASHGLIELGNNLALKEVTAHQIDISTGADIYYNTGLANLSFSGGPSGGFTIGNWNEIE